MTQVYLRQSSINTFMKCPERARHEFFVLDRDKQYYTDASATGQALHRAIEATMRQDIIAHPKAFTAYARAQLRIIDHEDGIRYVQNDLEHCLDYFKGWSNAFFNCQAAMDIMHHPDLRIEEPFCLKVGEREDVELWFEGKMDAVTYDVADWKTAARKYNEYEAQAWHIQPTMYVWAANTLGLTDERKFRYLVFPKTKSDPQVQIVPISRSLGATRFLMDQGWRIANLIKRMGTDGPWPTNDQHWLCSEKWCLNWNDCKGSFLSHGKE